MASFHEITQGRIHQILDSVKPELGKPELTRLLTHLQAYQDRVFRIGEIIEDPHIPAHSSFNYRSMPISNQLATEIDHRLELMSSYQLNNGSRVSELLTSGFHISFPMIFDSFQVRYLEALNRNPQSGLVALAKKLSVSPRTVTRESYKLWSHYRVHIGAILDIHQFGLVHYGIQFRAQSRDSAQKFDIWIRNELRFGKELPFLSGIGWDVNQVEGFFHILIPNQVKQLNRFENKMQEMKKQYLQTYKIHRIKGFYTNISFDFYNHVVGEWQITSDLLTEGTLQFIRKYGPQFPRLRGFDYSRQKISFKQTDWLLALCLSEGILTKTERRELLAKKGISLADKTIWAREHRLKNTKAVFPYLAFSRVAFKDYICIFVTCHESTLELFHQLSAQHALSQIIPTEDGAIILIGIPQGGASFMKQLTHTLVNISGLDLLAIFRLNREPALVPNLRTHRLWNEARKQWDETD